MQTVLETQRYDTRAAKLLTLDERDGLIDVVAADPLQGDLISGTGGIRKLRFAKGNRGKSAGVRVIYYYYSEAMPIHLLDIYGKNEKANLSKAECNALALVTAAIKKGSGL